MPYEPRYTWRQTKLDENDLPTDTDWCGYDDKEYIGRIRKEANGPTKGQWRWAGGWSRKLMGRPPTPNAGYAATARQATKMVEEFWDRCFSVMERR